MLSDCCTADVCCVHKRLLPAIFSLAMQHAALLLKLSSLVCHSQMAPDSWHSISLATANQHQQNTWPKPLATLKEPSTQPYATHTPVTFTQLQLHTQLQGHWRCRRANQRLAKPNLLRSCQLDQLLAALYQFWLC
jgi:hypothetical protein